MLIKVQLFHHRSTSEKTNRQKDRIKPRQIYHFAGHRVCRDLFAFAHGLHRQTVDAIAKSLDCKGFEPRHHGNKGKVPDHALTLYETKEVKKFIDNYAMQYGLPLPGRLANFRSEKAKLLPSNKNKNDIYSNYREAATLLESRTVSLSTFKKIWLEQCPNVVIMKPATDLCFKCQRYVQKITNSARLSEEEKSLLTTSYSLHIEHVKTQRDNYRNLCKDSEEIYCQLEHEKKQRGQAPCSNDVMVHYSFDYAQQVFYPHYAQQVGPMFFKTPRKCQCFGVACEASGSQVFYLVDEEFSCVGKGANSVTSLIHDHFKHSYGETRVELHMDNCSGQNKNNTVIGYGMWRVMNGLHKELQYNLMEAGHTKFAPDWHFGLWKVRWNKSDAEKLQDIGDTVSGSSRQGLNIPIIVDDSVQFNHWSKYCKDNFKPLPGLKKYHHFRMKSSVPGIVYAREHAADDEVEINILKKNSNIIGTFPEKITISGLDPQRQWYLYQEIAPLCMNSESACPKPDKPKPKKIKLE